MAKDKAAKSQKKKEERKIKIEDINLKNHNFLYYAIPSNLYKEIKLMGYPFKKSSILLTYIIVILIGCALGFVFKLGSLFSITDGVFTFHFANMFKYLILIGAGFLFAPTLVRNSYKNKYEGKRFSDVNIYVEQMLYAFKNSQKIFIALEDVQILFPAGAMRSAIDEAIEIISNRADDNVDVEALGLSIIEKRFPCEKIRTLHRFMKKSEEIGGNNAASIELLLAQRNAWENRTYQTVDARKQERIKIIGSIVASLLMSVMMLYVLPEEIDIASNIVAIIANMLLIIGSMFIYTVTDQKLCISLINPKRKSTDKTILKSYYNFVNYNSKKEIIKSLAWVAVGAGGLIATRVFLKGAASTVLTIFFAIFILIAIASSFIGHKINEKNVKREVQKAFPEWLLEMALLLQSDNVQMAIFKTVDNAPIILKPELVKLRNALYEDPSSSSPYLNFFSTLNIPTITTTMQMLYSLSVGSGGNADKQITNIIERNNKLLDRAEEMANEASLAPLYTLFFGPVALSAGVLMADMTIFLLSYLSTFSTF